MQSVRNALTHFTCEQSHITAFNLDFYKCKLVAGKINPYLLSFNSNACYITSDTYYEYL